MPDRPSADLAATVREAVNVATELNAYYVHEYGEFRLDRPMKFGINEWLLCEAVLALVARCEQIERERDEAVGNAAEWKERLELTLDSCPICGGTGQVELPERSMCASCDGYGQVTAASMYGRVEQLERTSQIRYDDYMAARAEANDLRSPVIRDRVWWLIIVASLLLALTLFARVVTGDARVPARGGTQRAPDPRLGV